MTDDSSRETVEQGENRLIAERRANEIDQFKKAATLHARVSKRRVEIVAPCGSHRLGRDPNDGAAA